MDQENKQTMLEVLLNWFTNMNWSTYYQLLANTLNIPLKCLAGMNCSVSDLLASILNASLNRLTNMDLKRILSHEQWGIIVALIVVGIVAAYIYISNRNKGCLDPKKFKEFKLVKKTWISSDTAKFRFTLPAPTSVLGLPVGQHVVCRGKDSEGKQVIRPYTPITLDSDVGYFELVVKMYPKGRMSHHFREMREGDFLAVKGPKGRFKYKPGQVRAFGMLAGGSGITPMFQLIRAILENLEDKTTVHLIYANNTFKDILLKEELDGFASNFPNRFKVFYVLVEPPEEWNGGVGHITRGMIRYHCPEPATNIKILRCGPQPMNKAMAAHLNFLGYTKEMQFEF